MLWSRKGENFGKEKILDLPHGIYLTSHLARGAIKQRMADGMFCNPQLILLQAEQGVRGSKSDLTARPAANRALKAQTPQHMA